MAAVPYDPTIYEGAAAHYRRGRPPYSPQLEAVLAEELGLDGRGRLLDGGCGPGILTVRLAHLFEEAVGLDPTRRCSPRAAGPRPERGVGNIRWVQARAEELPAAAPGPYRLVTFGQSFHWTDEARVAETVYDLLEPGGALALIVHTVEGRPAPPSPGPPPIPHAEIKALVQRYLGRPSAPARAPRRSGRTASKTSSSHPVRRAAVDLRPGIPDLVRDSESVVSGYFSLSSSAPHLFGDRAEEFAGEIGTYSRSRLPRASSGTGRATPSWILARK